MYSNVCQRWFAKYLKISSAPWILFLPRRTSINIILCIYVKLLSPCWTGSVYSTHLNTSSSKNVSSVDLLQIYNILNVEKRNIASVHSPNLRTMQNTNSPCTLVIRKKKHINAHSKPIHTNTTRSRADTYKRTQSSA